LPKIPLPNNRSAALHAPRNTSRSCRLRSRCGPGRRALRG